jgi:hypothetical protein
LPPKASPSPPWPSPPPTLPPAPPSTPPKLPAQPAAHPPSQAQGRRRRLDEDTYRPVSFDLESLATSENVSGGGRSPTRSPLGWASGKHGGANLGKKPSHELDPAKVALMGTDEYYASWDVFGLLRAVSRPFPSWNRSILTDIYLCHACSCQEILRMETAGQDDDEFDHPHADPLTMHAAGQVGHVTFMTDDGNHVLVDAHLVRPQRQRQRRQRRRPHQRRHCRRQCAVEWGEVGRMSAHRCLPALTDRYAVVAVVAVWVGGSCPRR